MLIDLALLAVAFGAGALGVERIIAGWATVRADATVEIQRLETLLHLTSALATASTAVTEAAATVASQVPASLAVKAENVVVASESTVVETPAGVS